jgi:hypothetical protein
MIKIFITVCNRLAVTKHCIEALKRHSKLPHQIYLYDNHPTYLIDEHFEYFRDLYKSGVLSQLTFNTKQSTFNAFSKASAFNQFGLTHECDPEKDKYDFLLVLDNDIIVMPGYDEILKNSWAEIKRKKLNNIKILSQTPGAIINTVPFNETICGFQAVLGRGGGSAFWSIQPNFFRDIGFLDLSTLVGQKKRHDTSYWGKINKITNGQPYTIGLRHKLCIHTGKIAGSVCNTYTRNKKHPKIEELVKFENEEKIISSMTFEEFFNKVSTDKACLTDW